MLHIMTVQNSLLFSGGAGLFFSPWRKTEICGSQTIFFVLILLLLELEGRILMF
jgi:hypothetical protein